MDTTSAFRIDGKVAVVTGAGSGIGEATAAVLAEAGACVIVADLSREKADKVATAIQASGGKAYARGVDVSDPNSVNDMVGSTVADYGQLDILVNNAGTQTRNAAVDITPDEFNRILGVNLNGVLYGSQAAARVMKAGSTIINTLSFIIDRPTAGTASYAASKKGAWALTRAFAVELGPAGVRVNAVAPGWTPTPWNSGRFVDESGNTDQAGFDALTERMKALSPLGNVAEPIDSALAVLYLASPAARHLTGQVIRVNGGATME